MNIEQIMALADEYADAYHLDNVGRFPEGAAGPRRNALVSALREALAPQPPVAWIAPYRIESITESGTMVTLRSKDPGFELPWVPLVVGAPVAVQPSKEKP